MRIIGHLDMDAFFAAVEERDHPRLAGRPIVVGSDPLEGRGRGIVSTANYKAREYGIRSAMPITKAWELSENARKKGLPPAAFMGGSYRTYSEVSHRIIEILKEHVPAQPTKDGKEVCLVQQASVDEAYFDLSYEGTKEDGYDRARRIAEEIKKDIKEKERLTASIGVGPNKLIAKISSDYKKPDGLTVVREEDAEAFLAPQNIRVIPGIGPKTEIRLKSLGVKTVQDAKRFTQKELEEWFGKWGTSLYEKLRGRSESPLVADRDVKSIGEQETFPHDVPGTERKTLEAALAAIAKDVHRRLIKDVEHGAGFNNFRAVAITVRFADFETKTRVVTLPQAIEANEKALETIQFQALRLFMPFLDRRENPQHKAFRLLGVRIERFSGTGVSGARSARVPATNALW